MEIKGVRGYKVLAKAPSCPHLMVPLTALLQPPFTDETTEAQGGGATCSGALGRE